MLTGSAFASALATVIAPYANSRPVHVIIRLFVLFEMSIVDHVIDINPDSEMDSDIHNRCPSNLGHKIGPQPG